MAQRGGGEVVFEHRFLASLNTRILSTTRGFLTPIDKDSRQPGVNNHGELVWMEFDGTGRQQIYSSLRGQLTFFGGSVSFLTADLPDINNNGAVVFRGVLEEGFVEGIFILEPAVEVFIDIKFCSNPNSFNCKKRGVLPVAVFGQGDLAVGDLDVESLRLCQPDMSGECTGAPLNWGFSDLGDPVTDLGTSSCGSKNQPDGFDDLSLAFDAQEVTAVIGCEALQKRDISPSLLLVGEFNDGTPIVSAAFDDVGIDQLLIQNR